MILLVTSVSDPNPVGSVLGILIENPDLDPDPDKKNLPTKKKLQERSCVSCFESARFFYYENPGSGSGSGFTKNARIDEYGF
jgi:hypothetical protein